MAVVASRSHFEKGKQHMKRIMRGGKEGYLGLQLCYAFHWYVWMKITALLFSMTMRMQLNLLISSFAEITKT